MMVRGNIIAGRPFCVVGFVQRGQNHDPLQDAGKNPGNVFGATSGHCATSTPESYVAEAV